MHTTRDLRYASDPNRFAYKKLRGGLQIAVIMLSSPCPVHPPFNCLKALWMLGADAPFAHKVLIHIGCSWSSAEKLQCIDWERVQLMQCKEPRGHHLAVLYSFFRSCVWRVT